jgi:hypothetical protein
LFLSLLTLLSLLFGLMLPNMYDSPGSGVNPLKVDGGAAGVEMTTGGGGDR